MKPIKVAILTSQPRVEKYYDLSTLPKDWELLFFSADFTDEEVLRRAGDADFIFADAIAPVSRTLIEGMPNLKMIHSEGVAYNRYDLEAARERGVYVCNNAAANSASVAEHAVLLMLALNRRLMEGDRMVRQGRQIQTKTRYILEGLPELYACHVGLIGFGAIGQATARLLRAFGSRVSYCAAHRKPPQLEQELGVQWLEQEELASQCDIVSLHLPVTPQTTGLVDARFLARMKPSALLINTAQPLAGGRCKGDFFAPCGGDYPVGLLQRPPLCLGKLSKVRQRGAAGQPGQQLTLSPGPCRSGRPPRSKDSGR